MLSTEIKILLQFINISNKEIEQFLEGSYKKDKFYNEHSNKYIDSLINIVEFKIHKINNDFTLIYSFFKVKFKFFKILYLFCFSIVNSKSYMILYKYKNNYEIIYTNKISRFNQFNESKSKSILKDIKKYLNFIYCINEIKYITLVK